MPEIIPFSTDLEAMEAELSWVEARIHRIQTQHRLHALIEGREVFMHHEKPLNRGTLERLLRKQTATETELRQTIDARRAFFHLLGDIGSSARLKLAQSRIALLDRKRFTPNVFEQSLIISKHAVVAQGEFITGRYS